MGKFAVLEENINSLVLTLQVLVCSQITPGLPLGKTGLKRVIRNKKGNLLTNTHSILCTSKNHFCRLYKLQGINIATQTKILTAESLA